MRWEYINITKAENMLMSGWKLYIYGNTVQSGKDAAYILDKLIKDMDVIAKIATNSIVLRNELSKRAWSSMVIYLSPFTAIWLDLFVHTMRLYLNYHHYPYKGKIPGALDICEGLIHLRYDLQIPIDPTIGCDYETYLANYRGEYGEYNIPNNQTLII